ncbi:hypothetical protein CEXT_407781 [Caerostris extrusa]|uniref:Uncharacterized protein n=1 Tax=Caerostris extrusa TaxID=172846 RepID=A0AAV4MTA1_CAEEX|nr:hypothetical protein CEXT_407781 [Caerostris extrusa]
MTFRRHPIECVKKCSVVTKLALQAISLKFYPAQQDAIYFFCERCSVKKRSDSPYDTLRPGSDGLEVLVPLEDGELGVSHLHRVEEGRRACSWRSQENSGSGRRVARASGLHSRPPSRERERALYCNGIKISSLWVPVTLLTEWGPEQHDR